MLLHKLPPARLNGLNCAAEYHRHDIRPVRRVSPHLVIAVMLVADIVGIALLAAATAGLRTPLTAQYPGRLVVLVMVAELAWALAARARRLYEPDRLPASLNGGWGLAESVAMTSAAVAAVAQFGGLASAVFQFLVTAGCTILWSFGTRRILRAALRLAWRRGVCLRRALIVATAPAAAAIAEAEILGGVNDFIRVVGGAPLAALAGTEGFNWVTRAVAEKQCDVIVLADFRPDIPAYSALHSILQDFAVEVAIIPADLACLPESLEIAHIGHARALRGVRHSCFGSRAGAKLCLDFALAALALGVCTPLLAAIAVAIKMDSSGPVIYRQWRVGLNGALFEIWKFRTMYHATGETAFQQTSRDDRRVTRIGRILRRTSMDELPQLINVLRGEMSVVGPRPHAIEMTVAGRPVADVVNAYAGRHRVKPGITGWAQINGSRGAVLTEWQLLRRVALDFDYIERWSLLLDLQILARTIKLVVHDSHAY